MTPCQAQIWWAEAEDKRRPVLVVTRTEAIPVLSTLVVAPVTRTVRGIPTEIFLDESDGMPDICAATFDNLQVIRRSFLTAFLTSIEARRRELCRALAALTNC